MNHLNLLHISTTWGDRIELVLILIVAINRPSFYLDNSSSFVNGVKQNYESSNSSIGSK